MLKILQSNKWRYVLSMTIAIVASSVLAYFFSRASIMLIPLVTVYVMQTSIGNSLYQGLKKFLVIFILVVLAGLYVHSMHFLYREMHDVILGVLIGIVANLLIFPRRADIEFRQSASRVLLKYQDYLNQILDRMRQKSGVTSNAELEKAIIGLPGWVHELGFDVGLQSGYRFFLIKLEQIADVLFSLHYLARFDYERDLLAAVDNQLDACEVKINNVIASLVHVLQLRKLDGDVEDFSSELEALEKEFYQIAPPSLELLDIRLDYLYFAEFIYCLWDLQRYLQRLAEALRHK